MTKKINHIGIAVNSIAASLAFYCDTLGMVFEGDEVVAEQKVKVAFLAVGESRIELLEPTGGPSARPKPKRYHATVDLDATRPGRDAGRIADEVVSHLVGLVGAKVKVTLEIPDAAKKDRALRLLDKAEHSCLITNSLKAPTSMEANVRISATASP